MLEKFSVSQKEVLLQGVNAYFVLTGHIAARFYKEKKLKVQKVVKLSFGVADNQDLPGDIIMISYHRKSWLYCV